MVMSGTVAIHQHDANTGCTEVINKHEKKIHERELCQFRKIVCDDCGEQVIPKSSRLHPCFVRKETDDVVREKIGRFAG